MRDLKKFVLILTTISLVTFTSCSSNDDGDSNNASGDEYITAKIGGTDWSASQDPATIIGATISNGVLAVQGGDNSGNTISFQVSNYTGVGTYNTGDSITNTSQIMYLTVTPVATWASSLASAALGTLPAGIIEVTAEDGTTVEGTFSFEGYNASDMTTKNITQGKFKAVLQ